jgi:phage terminase small subunit
MAKGSRKSDKVHQLNGTYRKDRHGNPEDKLDFKIEVPDIPSNLQGSAIKVWNKAIAELEPLGILTQMDGCLLGIFCELMGVHLDDPDGLTAAQNNQVRLIASEYGFTPGSRSKLSMPGAKKKTSDPFEGGL